MPPLPIHLSGGGLTMDQVESLKAYIGVCLMERMERGQTILFSAEQVQTMAEIANEFVMEILIELRDDPDLLYRLQQSFQARRQ